VAPYGAVAEDSPISLAESPTNCALIKQISDR
jgi:hypothetical protein